MSGSTATETGRIVEAFIACTLPKPEWTHHAHLRVGLWHVVVYGADAALPLLRERISRYNESVGTINSDDSGYHETLTAFYVKAIAAASADRDPLLGLDDLATVVIARIGAREYPLKFYSEERLFSVEARRGWVSPDLRSLSAWCHVPRRICTHLGTWHLAPGTLIVRPSPLPPGLSQLCARR